MKFSHILTLSATLLAGALFAGVAFAADAVIDAAKSTLVAQFSQLKVPVEAPFGKFSGSVHYEPGKPEAGRAHLEIDMGSLDVGDPDYNAEVRKPEWFNSAKYPTAIFEASSLRPLGGDKFEAVGALNLKGKTQNLTVPVSLSSAGGIDTYSGVVPISRKRFGIGDPQWQDTVADEVLIKFKIVAPR